MRVCKSSMFVVASRSVRHSPVVPTITARPDTGMMLSIWKRLLVPRRKHSSSK